ncbi:unnamed protein product [Polarella glacialis]|uniref:Reverse transcriptase Ty1/copia-type domain-containing protein n=1 Tax=Polarella glacialis TaxID=89957 RepID=A0A813J6U1_POLGL|nr:unnamed protein product [Polarella glacialis]
MESGKTADAYGLFPGHACEQADGESAYTQSVLKGEATWVRIPRERWPTLWFRGGDTSKPLYDDPVCPLILSLYGHPDAGGYWEKHCHAHLMKVGFKIASEDWRSCYFHEELKLFLVVYVDDFKLSGPKENLKKGWDLIGRADGIKIEPPAPAGKYLGCDHIITNRSIPECFNPRFTAEDTSLPPSPAKYVQAKFIKYDMRNFLEQCVERYQSLAGPRGANLRRVETPFLEEANAEFETEDSLPSGELQGIASKVLMKILYGQGWAGTTSSVPRAPWLQKSPNGLLFVIDSFIGWSVTLTPHLTSI